MPLYYFCTCKIYLKKLCRLLDVQSLGAIISVLAFPVELAVIQTMKKGYFFAHHRQSVIKIRDYR